MIFHSFTFLVFFMVVATAYFILPHKHRWVLLLVSSYLFYMTWNPILIVLVFITTLCSYILTQAIYHRKSKTAKKKLLIASLVIHFGLLFVFKYSMLLNEAVMAIYYQLATVFFSITESDPQRATLLADNLLLRYPLEQYHIILPLGISFYTLQVVAYTIDVYRGKAKPVMHYGIYSLYLIFFPQLFVGPIERSKHLIPQFFREQKFDPERILLGLKIVAYGFFKKIVIADRLDIIVNTIYSNPQEYTGLYLVVATLCFTIQIYCTLSGYSDIAVGLAKVLGFELHENFKHPFFSKSIYEFWKRWHISISTWFTDYVYTPLGGTRCSKERLFLNILCTFLLTGLWYGADMTLILWGCLHGIYIVIEIQSMRFRHDLRRTLYLENNMLGKAIQIVLTNILIAYAFILFRAESVGDWIYIIANLFDNFFRFSSMQYIYEVITSLGVSLYEIQLLCIAITFLFLAEYCSGKKQVYTQVERLPYIGRLAFYVGISTLILIGGTFHA